MPTIDAHDPGTICWIDLASTDAAAATEFYCELFGWTATEPIENAGGYRMLLHDGRQVAGLAPVWGDTDGSTWSTYVASADADQTCAAAVASGGDVVMDAMDVLAAGRMAILRDPAGAQVSVWQPGEHHGYEVHSEPGTPIWSELMTRDLESARAFYYSVFGWTAQEQDFDGVAVHRSGSGSDRLVGGALEMDESWPEDTPAALDGLHRDGRLRRHGAAAARRSAARSCIPRTTSARAAAPCWRIPRAATFSVITLRRRALRSHGGYARYAACATLGACRPSRSAPRSRGRARAPGSSARSASSPMPRRCGCRSSWSAPRARSSRTSTATRSSTSRAASAASPSATPTRPSRRAVQAQVARFLHTDFTIMPYDSYVELAERLCARAADLGRDARPRSSTAAPRPSRTPSRSRKAATGRPAVIAYEGAFHGRTHMAMSLTSKQHPYKAGFGPFAPEVYRVAYPYEYRWPGGGDAAEPARSTICASPSRRASRRSRWRRS